MKCGREPDGKHKDLGICPAAVPNQYNSINNGTCGGRFCWAFAGTFCGGEVQGSVARKLHDCLECVFLRLVREQEGQDFILTPDEASRKNK